MMALHTLLNQALSFPWRLLSPDSPWLLLVGISFYSAVLLLLVFRVCSRQAALQAGKEQLLARLLELVLWRDDPGESLHAFRRILRANNRYLRELVRPLAAGLLPFIVLLVHAESWLAWKPPPVHGTVLLTAAFHEPAHPLLNVQPQGDHELQIIAPVVYAQADGTWWWTVQPQQRGIAHLTLPGGADQVERKQIAAGNGIRLPLQPKRVAGWMAWLLSPIEPPLGADSPWRSITVRYPHQMYRIGPRNVSWFWPYLLITMLWAALLKTPLRVMV